MAKNPTNQPNSPEPSDTPSPTTVVSERKPFDPTRSREETKTYSDAVQENHEFDFARQIQAARRPQEPPVHVPPKPAPGVLAQTKLEMEAGAKRVSEFEAEEGMRKAAHEAHRRDKWADKGSTEVFRPADYVPDQGKGQGTIRSTSTNT